MTTKTKAATQFVIPSYKIEGSEIIWKGKLKGDRGAEGKLKVRIPLGEIIDELKEKGIGYYE